MRRHQPAVKLCRRLLGPVRDDQLRIHGHVLTTIKSGESCDTPVPPRCARVSAGVGMGGWTALRATGWSSCGPSGPPAARSAVQHLRFVPAPDCGGGRGTVWLSNERLQLVFIQSGSEFPFHPFGHLLPGAPGGFHLFEDIERFY